MNGIPFSNSAQSLGLDRLGRELRLAPLTRRDARELAAVFAGIDPWKRVLKQRSGRTDKSVSWPADRLEKYLGECRPGAPRFLIECDGERAGAVGIEAPWLHGAYLRFLGLVPDFQNTGIGVAVMTWFEREASGSTGNLWVCVSAFNHRAAAFYERQGYVQVAVFDDLIVEGEDEILLRKRI